jgi:hypothetical protein
MKTKSFEIGGLYLVEFDDHCLGEGVLPCRVVGWVLRQDPKQVVLTFWDTMSDPETKAANNEPVSILKSAITRKKKLPEFRD